MRFKQKRDRGTCVVLAIVLCVIVSLCRSSFIFFHSRENVKIIWICEHATYLLAKARSILDTQPSLRSIFVLLLILRCLDFLALVILKVACWFSCFFFFFAVVAVAAVFLVLLRLVVAFLVVISCCLMKSYEHDDSTPC